MSWLGIDVGTTGCKAAAYDGSGRRIASAYREYRTLHPRPGWSELDSVGVWRLVREAIADVAARTLDDPIRALCVSSLGEAMTPVSADRRILGNSILCSDSRGGEYAEAVRERIGQERFYAINPNILNAGYSMPKLAWLRDHDPRLYGSAHRFLLWGDLVGFLLGAEPVTSYAHANRTLLFDIHAEDWSDLLLGMCGISREILPMPVASGTVAGSVSDAMARELGLPLGTPVVVGAHDQCCNALGAGVIGPGAAVCGIGTFECYAPAFAMPSDPLAMLRSGLNIEHHVVAGVFLTFAYNQSGSLVRWFRDTFAGAQMDAAPSAPASRPSGDSVYDLLTSEMPTEPTDLLVLPYFEPTGPPGFVEDAAGAVVGLKPTTTRGEILKAIMESSTLYFVEIMAALRDLGLGVESFTATGGGARSDAWLQIKADVFGVPFHRPAETEAGALGAAMLAAIALGGFDDASDAVAACVRREVTFEPEPGRHARYTEKAAAYARLYPSLRDVLADPRR
jgi:xylulokinase